MIILLHGDQTEASRAEYIHLKDAAKQKEVLDGKTLDETGLIQAVESQSMFSAKGGPASGWGGDKTVFIDNLFGKLGRKIKLIEKLATIIRESAVDVVLWEDKEVGATVIKSLGKVDVKLFKMPGVLFQFLDTFSLKTYQKLQEPELVHFMLTKRVRQLIQLKDGATPAGLAGWQAGKLTSQAAGFTMERLLAMYKRLLDMEFSIKNGSSPFDIRQLTEQLLLDV